MKPILITGATGFLGQHVVTQLRDSGRPLRLMCRGASKWDAEPGVEVVHGDVTSQSDVARAIEGVGSVYHLAGIVSRDPKDAILLHRVHADGTRHICEAAAKAGVDRVLLASSSGTIAVSREPVVHNEESGYKIDIISRWAYYHSKMFAEKAALSVYAREKLPVVIVNPALLLGPGDDRGSSTGDLAMLLAGEIPSMPGGGMSFVDARDCAAGCIAAMEKGRPGERYLLGGPNMTFRQMIYLVAGIANIRPPLLELSLGVSQALAPVMRKVMPLAGREFKMDDATIEMSAMFWYVDSSKASRELGFTTRDPVETLRDTLADLRRRGLPHS